MTDEQKNALALIIALSGLVAWLLWGKRGVLAWLIPGVPPPGPFG